MRGFQVEDLGFLFYVRRANIDPENSLSVSLTPKE
jgi:hypothetical protein